MIKYVNPAKGYVNKLKKNMTETKKITVYSTPACMYCNMLKDFLKEKEVAFESIDVSEQPEKAAYIAEKTGQLGVPVTEIDGQFIIGFNPEKLMELADIK